MIRKITIGAALFFLFSSAGVDAAGPRGRSLNWGLCPAESGIEQRPSTEGLEPGFSAVEGDEATLVEDGLSNFSGNVELVRDTDALRADKLTYDEPNRTAEAFGNTRLWSGSMFWEGEHAFLNLNEDRGLLENGRYQLTETHGRGEAASIEHNMRRDISKLKDVDYTTCESGGTPTWEISASKLFLDHGEEWGSARNAVLRFKGVPVAYTPYISFPLTDKRKTGFLPPTFGGSRDSGADITTPFYWNIAPNYDATLSPRFLGTRGVMLGGEGRYLFQSWHGALSATLLPNDNKLDDADRWLVQFRHIQDFDSSHGHLSIDFNNVSDKQYLEDFGNSLSVTSTRFLDRNAILTYARNWWSIYARVNSYQSVDRTLPGADRPYDIMPQIYYYTGFPSLYPHVNFQVYGETTYFDRTDTVTGGRFNLKPFVSFPFEKPWGFATPKIALDQTWYELDANSFGENRLSRTVPTLSLDSGVFFERELTLASNRYLHTLEPRLYYLYRPEVEQDDIPLFDTGEYDFSFGQLFRENRYSSIDRLGDSNAITLALSSRQRWSDLLLAGSGSGVADPDHADESFVRNRHRGFFAGQSGLVGRWRIAVGSQRRPDAAQRRTPEVSPRGKQDLQFRLPVSPPGKRGTNGSIFPLAAQSQLGLVGPLELFPARQSNIGGFWRCGIRGMLLGCQTCRPSLYQYVARQIRQCSVPSGRTQGTGRARPRDDFVPEKEHSRLYQ